MLFNPEAKLLDGREVCDVFPPFSLKSGSLTSIHSFHIPQRAAYFSLIDLTLLTSNHCQECLRTTVPEPKIHPRYHGAGLRFEDPQVRLHSGTNKQTPKAKANPRFRLRRSPQVPLERRRLRRRSKKAADNRTSNLHQRRLWRHQTVSQESSPVQHGQGPIVILTVKAFATQGRHGSRMVLRSPDHLHRTAQLGRDLEPL